MRHNIPTIPLFKDTAPGGAIEQLALRVLIAFPNWELHVLGTACLIAGHLALTARHVIAAGIDMCGYTKDGDNLSVTKAQILLLQVLPGPVYRFWSVMRAWIAASDIAILQLALDGASDLNAPVEWKAPPLRATPPLTGEAVVAFGYRESVVRPSTGPTGSLHIDIDDKPTTSAGRVGQIFPTQRDASMLNFPCFEVQAEFAPGMSGGLVIDGDGQLCGLICAGTKFADPSAPPLSYAATLWPFLTTEISADRGDKYPRGVSYPAIDLALDHFISVSRLEELDPRLFPGKKVPTGDHIPDS
jgi:hypothetical protein